MKPENPKVGWEKSVQPVLTKSTETHRGRRKHPGYTKDFDNGDLLIQLFRGSQSDEPIKWKALWMYVVAFLSTLLLTGIFLSYLNYLAVSLIHFFVFNFAATAVQVCWYTSFYSQPTQESNSKLRSFKTKLNMTRLTLYPFIYALLNAPVLHIAFKDPSLIGLSPWLACITAFAFALVSALAMYGAGYIFDVPNAAKTEKLKKDWKHCMMLAGYNLFFVFIMLVYLLAFTSMTYELQIILAYLYPFLDWGFLYIQNKITRKVNDEFVIGTVFFLQMLSASFFLVYMLSSASSTLGSLFLVVFRSLAHFMEYIRATDYYYTRFARLPSSLHDQGLNLREIYHFSKKVNFYITMVVEFTCIFTFYPIATISHIVKETTIPIKQFLFVGIYASCLFITTLIIWLGFKKIEVSHKFHDKSIQVLINYLYKNWLNILYSIEFCTDLIYIGLTLSPK